MKAKVDFQDLAGARTAATKRPSLVVIRDTCDCNLEAIIWAWPAKSVCVDIKRGPGVVSDKDSCSAGKIPTSFTAKEKARQPFRLAGLIRTVALS
jgi:hypothetical protein